NPFRDLLHRLIFQRDSRDMRRNAHARMPPIRVVLWQGLVVENIQYRGLQLTGVEGGQNVSIHDMPTSGDVDEDGMRLELCDQCGVDDACGFGRKRKKVHQDTRTRQKSLKLPIAMKSFDALVFAGTTRPSGHRISHCRHALCDMAAELAQTHDPDRPLRMAN